MVNLIWYSIFIITLILNPIQMKCPSRNDIPLEAMLHISKDFVSRFLKFKKEKNEGSSNIFYDFCNTEIDFEDNDLVEPKSIDIDEFDVLCSLPKDTTTPNNGQKDNFQHDKKVSAKDGYNPAITDLNLDSKYVTFNVEYDNKKFLIKSGINKEIIGLNLKKLGYDPTEYIGIDSLTFKELQMNIFNEIDFLTDLRGVGTAINSIVEICLYNQKDAIWYLYGIEQKQLTLRSYIDKLKLEKDPISYHSRLTMYKKLASLVSNLNENGVIHCSIGMDDIAIDVVDGKINSDATLDTMRIASFDNLTTQNDCKMDINENPYSPPEQNTPHDYANRVVLAKQLIEHTKIENIHNPLLQKFFIERIGSVATQENEILAEIEKNLKDISQGIETHDIDPADNDRDYINKTMELTILKSKSETNHKNANSFLNKGLNEVTADELAKFKGLLARYDEFPPKKKAQPFPFVYSPNNYKTHDVYSLGLIIMFIEISLAPSKEYAYRETLLEDFNKILRTYRGLEFQSNQARDYKNYQTYDDFIHKIELLINKIPYSEQQASKLLYYIKDNILVHALIRKSSLQFKEYIESISAEKLRI